MTLPDKRDPLLRYFGGNDEYVSPQEYRLRVGKGKHLWTRTTLSRDAFGEWAKED